jgi:hypothetical protein
VRPVVEALTQNLGSRQIRASYPIVDHTERFVAPTSMRFSPDGSRFVLALLSLDKTILILISTLEIVCTVGLRTLLRSSTFRGPEKKGFD